MEHSLIISLLQASTPIHHLRQIHALIIRACPSLTHVFLRILLKQSTIHYARQVFDAMPQPDSLLSNSILSAHSKLSLHGEALEIFVLSHRKNIQVNFFSIPSVLKACASLAVLDAGKQVHSLVRKLGFFSNVFIQTALIDFYVKNDDICSAQRAFDEIVDKDPVPYNCLISGYSKSGNVVAARHLFDEMTQRTASSWNTIITCYAHQENFDEALRLFERMREEGFQTNEITIVIVLSICAKLADLETGLKVRKLIDEHHSRTSLIVRTAILEMYVKCGAVDEARLEFDQMDHRDVVAWTAMIAGYAQNGRSNEALELFEKMQFECFDPNEVTLVSVLSACAQLGSVQVGERIGSYVESMSFNSSVYVNSALLDMYAKCGNIQKACRVFNEMSLKDIISWNSLIGGLAYNGLAEDAINLYYKMIEESLKPNEITFVGLLTACTHAGLVDLGLKFFRSMRSDHNIVPKVEHCACIVDLFCRSGRVEDAFKFICEMEMVPNVVIWGTLLSACRIHSNVELAKISMEKLLKLEPENSANYVLFSYLCADAGQWEEARSMRKLMQSKNVQKLAAYSWIELDDRLHKFLVGDRLHFRSDEIYDVVDGLSLQLKWVPDFDLDQPF
ncbi:pentatricopeptide repeat-containing protein At1g08070, chloroplastic [Dendrobium catenatum]|uniref:Pentatricopeptide repeat-containing protein n=1 Tax=Dendrobium catenatum TaxID=906689 RepID=A0A2I0WK14_9ASPA|nr:pentatricopeptide repeat-containing protein At1g08070, chloroplastic [Dendrobium catenatum]PKU75992.1 Pentatricopeptide repeat-containing protein [Dendrobium catenatum]